MTNRNRFQSATLLAVPLFLFIGGTVHFQETASSALPTQELRDLATRILKNAPRSICELQSCRILVTNLTLASGSTSPLGMKLADELSREITSQQSAIQSIDRPQLGSYLEQERIPTALLNNEKAIRWLGKRLGASAVLAGTTEDKAGSLLLKVRLFSCEKEEKGPEEELIFPHPDLKSGLTPVEPFPPTPPTLGLFSDSGIFRAGKGGVGTPVCVYCPPPSFTVLARDAKFGGTVLLDVVLSAEGEVKAARILRGAPFGMNEVAINHVSGWRLKRSTLQGKPVQAAVQIEMTFHLN
jgi:Gram-negative bacterial TonB protein C-terminal